MRRCHLGSVSGWCVELLRKAGACEMRLWLLRSVLALPGSGWLAIALRGSVGYKTRVDRDGVKRKVIGWEYVHVAIDDATRLAYAEVLPDEKAAPRSDSCDERSRSSSVTACRSANCSQTTGRLIAPPFMRSPAEHSAFATCEPGHADPRPTARQSASSARCSEAGPTARSTAQAPSAQPPLTAGYGPITIDADIKPSGDRHPSTA